MGDISGIALEPSLNQGTGAETCQGLSPADTDHRPAEQIQHLQDIINKGRTPDGLTPVDQVLRELVVQALDLTHGNVKSAAGKLGVGRQTLYNWISRYSITNSRI